MWRRYATLAVLLLVITAGCSSGDTDDGSTASGDEPAVGDVGTVTEMDPGFNTGNLPDDFPSQLIPDDFTAGMYSELGNIRNVNFESSSSFDDVVAELTGKIGEEPIVVEGEERLAQWTVDIWLVAVIDSAPTLITVTTAE